VEAGAFAGLDLEYLSGCMRVVVCFVLRMCDDVMMYWRMRDGVPSPPCECAVWCAGSLAATRSRACRLKPSRDSTTWRF